jgi:predicted AlkP superfamily phosphohydrolase/phosphomutase
VLIIGLDCASPRFLFGPEAFDLPNLRRLMNAGIHGRLRTCDPPITAPAWACIASGRDPGELGVYGFRARHNNSYGSRPVNSLDVLQPRLWDTLSAAGKRCIVLGVPLTHPVRPLRGCMAAGPLCPPDTDGATYPRGLQKRAESAAGLYIPDVRDYRTDDKASLLTRIREAMDNRFAWGRRLMQTESWDFFMMVDMSLDRLHHGFWRYADPAHPRHEPAHALAQAFRLHYETLDERIGELVELAGTNTAVLVLSDHGARPLLGGFRINQWLLDKGWLRLKERAASPAALDPSMVDWTRSRAWAWGGHCARIFFNVRGREPEGCIAPDALVDIKAELASALRAAPSGPTTTRAHEVLDPQTIYRQAAGFPPDLMVYCGGLDLRALGEVGRAEGDWFAEGNDAGPDDANHDPEGILIAAGGLLSSKCVGKSCSYRATTPAVLEHFGVQNK